MPPISPVRTSAITRLAVFRVPSVTPIRYDKSTMSRIGFRRLGHDNLPPRRSWRGAAAGRRGDCEKMLGMPYTDEPGLGFHGDREVAAGLVDLAVNVRADPMPEWLAAPLRAALDDLARY